MKYNQESLTSELSKHLAEKEESQQRIKDLEEDIKVLNDRKKEGDVEVERQVCGTYGCLNVCLGIFPLAFFFFLSHRLKERVKKMSGQMKHDEEKRKTLQVIASSRVKTQTALSETMPSVSQRTRSSAKSRFRRLGVILSAVGALIAFTFPFLIMFLIRPEL